MPVYFLLYCYITLHSISWLNIMQYIQNKLNTNGLYNVYFELFQTMSAISLLVFLACVSYGEWGFNQIWCIFVMNQIHIEQHIHTLRHFWATIGSNIKLHYLILHNREVFSLLLAFTPISWSWTKYIFNNTYIHTERHFWTTTGSNAKLY